MWRMNLLLTEIVTLLEETRNCDHIKILETSFFSHAQFALKIKCRIFSQYLFQIRIYFNKGHFDYSYQIHNQEPICRWANKEHFPHLKTHPHHYHTIEKQVIESPLQGNPIEDLKRVLHVKLNKYCGLTLSWGVRFQNKRKGRCFLF